MTDPHVACDHAMLTALLEETLPSEREHELLLHLEACLCCQSALQEEAADESLWLEYSSALKVEPHDMILLGLVSDSQGEFAPERMRLKQVIRTLAPTDDPAMLGRIGTYEVSGVVGGGGMGVVLKAHDRSLDRIVAIKVLAPHLAVSGSARQRFAREAKAAAAVLHPNVIAIHGVSKEGELPYLVMPYIHGNSLQKRIDKEGPLPLRDVLRIGAQIASGLAAAHQQGLVHRDVKPANVLLEDGVERVALSDFGLARAADDASLTASGVIAGTPQYMSPEQGRGEPVDHRSDLFSLGSVLYAMCVGHPPFRAETPYGVLHRITNDSPRPIGELNPDIPPWLCRLIARLHEKRPKDRLQFAADAEQLLLRCLAHVEQPDKQPIPEELFDTVPQWLRLKGVAVVFLVGTLVLTAFLKREQIVDSSQKADSGPSNHVKHETTDGEMQIRTPTESTMDVESAWADPEMADTIELLEQTRRLERENQDSFLEGPNTH